MFKSQAIMTYAQIFNPGDKYLQPILRANRVTGCFVCMSLFQFVSSQNEKKDGSDKTKTK